MNNKNLQKLTQDLPSIFSSFELLSQPHRISTMKTVTAILDTKRKIHQELLKLEIALNEAI